MNEKTNDMDARFEQFYAANFPRVKNFARLLTKSEEDAEDIAQNIFLKLWTRPDLWQGQESMTGYLYTVTRNVEQEYESHIIRSQLIGELCDEDTSLLENLYYKEIVLLVELALNQLPPRRKQVFEMSRIEGLSHKEIAEKLQIPVRTVEDHIYKTLTELRKVLMFVILPVLFP